MTEEMVPPDPAIIADELRRRMDRVPDSDSVLVAKAQLAALLEERSEVESAVTDFADSTESGAGLPDLVADMWSRIKRLEGLLMERAQS